MLRVLPENKGFATEMFTRGERLKVGIIDADLLDHGTRHPNLALEKIAGFCKAQGHDVRLICSYDELDVDPKFFDVETLDYDVLCLSQVFKFTKRPKKIDFLIKNHLMFYGGTGFLEEFEDDLKQLPNLPPEVEHHKPDFNLYDEYIQIQTGGDPKKMKRDWDDYISYSIGFTTRGCIRHCAFCVNRELSRVLEWSPVEEFLDPTRPKIYLWDDNIMAAPAKVFKKVIDQLVATGKAFQFRQGMDIRLMTDEKAKLFRDVKYYGDYIFAFDHYRKDDPNEWKQVEQTIRGLEIWKKYVTRETKLYVLVAFDSIDEKDIEGAFWRIKTLMEYGCLPYIMRFEDYKKSRFKCLYTQLARWCNQPSFFKKMSFRQYCVRNEEYRQGIQKKITNGKYPNKLKFPKGFKPKPTYCACYRAMIEFEEEFPEIAKKYYDIRFEDINPYKIKK